jgi:hypothetical protein
MVLPQSRLRNQIGAGSERYQAVGRPVFSCSLVGFERKQMTF